MTSIPDSHKDLLDAKFATFATIGPDGRPQLSEVWFLAEGDSVALSLSNTRQKTKNLEKRPSGTLFILDPENPFRYLEIRGDVEMTSDDDYSFATKVGAKYDTDLRTFDQPGDVRVKAAIKATRVNAVAMG
jgi:PPOX class probable F420-dependent enzyme